MLYFWIKPRISPAYSAKQSEQSIGESNFGFSFPRRRMVYDRTLLGDPCVVALQRKQLCCCGVVFTPGFSSFVSIRLLQKTAALRRIGIEPIARRLGDKTLQAPSPRPAEPNRTPVGRCRNHERPGPFDAPSDICSAIGLAVTRALAHTRATAS